MQVVTEAIFKSVADVMLSRPLPFQHNQFLEAKIYYIDSNAPSRMD